MKKISTYIGLGVLGTLAFGLLFYLVLSLISLGTIFDAFGRDAGRGFVILLAWIGSVSIMSLLVVFLAISLIKAIPNINKVDDEDKSLFRMNFISGLLAIEMVYSTIFTFILTAMSGNRVGGASIVAFILALIAAGAAVVSFLFKKLPLLVRIILDLVAQFLALVLIILSIGNGGLYTVYAIFAMLALFGGLAYVVLSNLDCFKGQNKQ